MKLLEVTVKIQYEAYSVIDQKWKWSTSIVSRDGLDALLAKLRTAKNYRNVSIVPPERDEG
jgi:hypothetical protein